MGEPILKYLFRCLFTDGTVLEQTPDDKGYSPDARNSYSDVLYAQKLGKRIEKFSIDSGNNWILVDLLNGTFMVNGFTVLLEGDRLPCLPDKFELIWYHQVTQNQNVTFDKKSGEVLKRENLPEFREYFIGWKCTIKGKEYQQKMAVA